MCDHFKTITNTLRRH